MIAPTGDGQPVAILNPVLVIRWCVALEGIFCARN